MSPSMSPSNPASQDQPSQSGRKVMQKNQQRAPLVARKTASFPRNEASLPVDVTVAHDSGLDRAYVHGHKRTASGDVKSGGANSPTSPIFNIPRQRARPTSLSFNESQIEEIAAKLRRRLHWAMVKVQRGWEMHSLSEIEAMTSQQLSPISTTTTAASLPLSSPTTIYPTFAQSSNGSTATPEATHTAPHLHSGTTALDYAYPRSQSDPAFSPDHPSRTYEQFWRDHPSASRLPHYQPSGPTLAPPVDIQPRRSNHSSLSAYQSLSLQTNITRPTAGSSAVPITPTKPHARAPAIRTPSQKAKMEKDAVETLLFMSSPSHSALRSARTLADSPTANAKKVGFASEEAITGFSSDEDDDNDAPAAKGGVALSPMRLSLQSPLALGLGMAVRGGGVRVGLGGKKDDDAIDRMLDGMAAAEQEGESSSDDDDEEVARVVGRALAGMGRI